MPRNALLSQFRSQNTSPSNPLTARTAGSCDHPGARKAPGFSTTILSAGGFTFILEKPGFNSCHRLPPYGADKGCKLASVITDTPLHLSARHSGAHSQTGGAFLCPPRGRVLIVNSVVIPPSKSVLQLFVLWPSGRPKWARASARNCGRRTAGRDACPCSPLLCPKKLFIYPFTLQRLIFISSGFSFLTLHRSGPIFLPQPFPMTKECSGRERSLPR